MTALPVVAIVGRPNVGKSTLFNRLSQTRRAIVDSVPGVTRDRIELPVEWAGRWFRLVDTGGIDFGDPETIPVQIVEQAKVALASSDVIVFLVDARHGLSPVEEELAELRPLARAQVGAVGDHGVAGLVALPLARRDARRRQDVVADSLVMPERLASHPTLNEQYVSPADISRMVMKQYCGWWDDIPSHWSPSTFDRQARVIAEVWPVATQPVPTTVPELDVPVEPEIDWKSLP